MFGLSFLTPKMIGVIAVIAATLGAAGYVFHLGGEAPRAELAMQEKAIADAYKIRVANERRKDAQTLTLITTLEEKHGKDLFDTAAAWKQFHDGELRDREAADRTRAGRKPISTDSKVCGDADRDHRLSVAIQEYRVEARSSLDQCIGAARQGRREVEPLLVTAGEQAGDLVLLKSYVLGARNINTNP